MKLSILPTIIASIGAISSNLRGTNNPEEFFSLIPTTGQQGSYSLQQTPRLLIPHSVDNKRQETQKSQEEPFNNNAPVLTGNSTNTSTSTKTKKSSKKENNSIAVPLVLLAIPEIIVGSICCLIRCKCLQPREPEGIPAINNQVNTPVGLGTNANLSTRTVATNMTV